VTAFGGRKRQQFNERARAHEDLSAERVRGGQKTVGIKAESDLIRVSEIAIHGCKLCGLGARIA